MHPTGQRYVAAEALDQPETFYPLHAWVCHVCFLVQLEEVVPEAELFEGGVHNGFSSDSAFWLRHAKRFADEIVERLGLDDRRRVFEVGSNDGYLLQYFVRRGIPSLGIDPARNVARAARDKGVETVEWFFGRATARDLAGSRGAADLLIANNVLPRVPDLNDFVAGLSILLARDGVLTMELPHLMRLVEENQFDTIGHEHYSYLSFTTLERILAQHELVVFDVQELSTHGGSLRVYARHAACHRHATSPQVDAMREREARAGMDSLAYYARFAERVKEIRRTLLEFLIEARRGGKSVVGYGAPGKGNTLLNYCGIGRDFLDYTADRSPHRQGRFTPGTRIPILEPERILETEPDYVLILPWRLADEITEQLAAVREWKGQFVVPIPEVRILP
jgi:2-polyprenyl-3-methyl-5-hydroxy-6-metoxy-1,4-benzoquinol methylase